MNRLSKFVERIEWTLASPASDSVDGDSEIFVSRKAVKKVRNLLRTYVLINLISPKKIADSKGYEKYYRSVIYRRDLSVVTNLSRISSINFFTDVFASGDISLSFFYHHEPWLDDTEVLAAPLVQFMLNHAPEK